MQIALDGPAGSGKSTVCKLIAQRNGFIYLDTGAMYRTCAYILDKFFSGKSPDDSHFIAAINSISFLFKDNGNDITVLYNGAIKGAPESENLTELIRTPYISSKVSSVAKEPLVRSAMVQKQQEYAKGNSVIMEGRDIASVVLPNAEVKIFLTASKEERARRRFLELEKKGVASSFETVLADIIKRDEADEAREASPLKQVAGATLLDTTGLTLEEVAEKISKIIEKKR